jgi:hypothetical protein
MRGRPIRRIYNSVTDDINALKRPMILMRAHHLGPMLGLMVSATALQHQRGAQRSRRGRVAR